MSLTQPANSEVAPRDEETNRDPANEEAVSEDARKKDKIITYVFEILVKGRRALHTATKTLRNKQ